MVTVRNLPSDIVAQNKWVAHSVERLQVSDLTPYTKNARTHGDEQINRLCASIDEWDSTVPLLTDARRAIIAGHGRVLAAMFEQFMTMLTGADAPNPQDVADAVSKLVAQPSGARAARVVVGSSFGADAVNAATAPVQAATVKALGLDRLDTSEAA